MMHAAERQHLRAVFAGGDVADRLALRAHGRGLRAQIAVGVDLHLDAAIGEDSLGDDGHHVDAVDFRRDDERCRLVVRIGRARTDRGDEGRGFVDDLAVPVFRAAERHKLAAMRNGALQDHVRIDANELAVVIGIAIAGARRARLDVAHHRTGIAADLVGGGARRFSHHVQASGHCGYHSYTNDVARGPDSCQAAARAKRCAAE
ncbi:hypothetical protein ABIF57_003304 [Bradyrhizobium diazoefficiens]